MYNQMGGMHQQWPMQHQEPIVEGKGKGKQIDFDAAFDEITAQVAQTNLTEELAGPSEAEADLIARFDDSADLNEILDKANSVASVFLAS
jgi:hypothetical protein